MTTKGEKTMRIFSCYDSKAEAYLNPFLLRSRGEALRSFENVVNTPDNNSWIYKNPEDYTLFEIGEFDERTGVIKAYEAKVSLGSGNDFKKSEA